MQYNEPILGIEGSRDEKLESLIRNIAAEEVQEKVEKFKDEYNEQKENDVFSAIIRDVMSK